jgi:hypothetical protein
MCHCDAARRPRTDPLPAGRRHSPAAAKRAAGQPAQKLNSGIGASADRPDPADSGDAAVALILSMELSRYCPGIVTAMG